MFSYEANNINTINSKKNEDTEHVPSGEFQPEEMNILGEKRERTTMTTQTGRSIVKLICVCLVSNIT